MNRFQFHILDRLNAASDNLFCTAEAMYNDGIATDFTKYKANPTVINATLHRRHRLNRYTMAAVRHQFWFAVAKHTITPLCYTDMYDICPPVQGDC